MKIEKKISEELSYEVEVVGGSLLLKVIYGGKYAGASVVVNMDALDFLEMFVASTENKLDDAALAMLKAAIK